MKLNQDCVRDILLSLEEFLTFDNSINSINQIKSLNNLSKYSDDDLLYCVSKLNETNFLNMNIKYADNSIYWLSISSITWDGHEFIDTIRDNKVWKKTKEVTSNFTSVSISTLSTIGSEIISGMIKNILPI